ncbi:MAG: hypothetical protein Q4G04_04320, partial [bacterium]|nr:hypothetical protein [bacterium]
MQNQNFSFTINAEAGNCPINLDNSGANAPVLAEGMIPVRWDGAKWVKADETNSTQTYQWYDYSGKLWANAVMVSTAGGGVTGSKTRQQYMDANPGTTILEDDILAYYVWIPRYRYELFNVGTDTVPEQLIEVTFETADTLKSDGKCNGNHETETNGCDLTHPAFTWGTDASIQELDGIWVGKFETTGEEASPTVKPNLSPMNGMVSTLYSANNRMSTETYLTTTGVSEIDVHMMKNTEWGAVAYLKQSAYGLGITDVAPNNVCSGFECCDGGFITGCGSEIGTTTATTTCNNDYTTTNGQKASTTGNITGVYDMAGGGSDNVMGVYSNSSGTAINYGPYDGPGGFNPTLSCTSNTYVNCYLAPSSYSDYSKRILGDATAETRAWYSAYAGVVNGGYAWVVRRGGFFDDGTAGFALFAFFTGNGWGHYEDTSRVSAFVIK